MLLRSLVKCIIGLFVSPPPPPPKTRAEINAALLAKARAEGRPEPDVNSIVDVCKVFDLDSSLEGRRDLRRELGLKGDYSGTAEQNDELMEALHKHLAKGEIWNETR